jgi:opacity protein-like surface antigen
VNPDSGFYLGVGLGGLRIDEDPYEFNPGWGSFSGRAGYTFNPYFKVEAEALIAFNPYTFDDDGENYDDPDAPDLSTAFAGYIIPRLPVSPTLGIYGRLGYLTAEYEYDNGITTESSGTGIGAGVDFAVGRTMSLYMDYTWFNLSNTDSLGGATFDYDASGSLLSIGVMNRF